MLARGHRSIDASDFRIFAGEMAAFFDGWVLAYDRNSRVVART